MLVSVYAVGDCSTCLGAYGIALGAQEGVWLSLRPGCALPLLCRSLKAIGSGMTVPGGVHCTRNVSASIRRCAGESQSPHAATWCPARALRRLPIEFSGARTRAPLPVRVRGVQGP